MLSARHCARCWKIKDEWRSHFFRKGKRNTSTISHSTINGIGYNEDQPRSLGALKGNNFSWSGGQCRKLHLGDDTCNGLWGISWENAIICKNSAFEQTQNMLPNQTPAKSLSLEKGKSERTKELYFRKVSWSHIRVPGSIKQFVKVWLS